MTVLSFTARNTVTVTITAKQFADDAREHAAAATRYATLAATVVDDAEQAAARLPEAWRSPGGADAAYVVAMVAEEAKQAATSAHGSRAAAVEAATADTAQHAAWAEQEADVYARGARRALADAARLAAYLTVPNLRAV